MGTHETEASKLAEVLASASDVLFPEDDGDNHVGLHSAGLCGDTALHVMVWRMNTEAVKLLIGAGADVNAIGEMEETPLHVAVRKGNVEIAKALLEAKALTSVRSRLGKTAAESAAEQGGAMAEIFQRYKRFSKSLAR